MESQLYLFLQTGWRVFPTKSGVEVGSAIKSTRFRVSGVPVDHLQILFSFLEEGVPLHTAAQELAERSALDVHTVEKILAHLSANDATISKPRSENETSDGLYDRQIRYYNAFETSQVSGADLNGKLQNRRVLLVGAGGYGTWISLLLTRMGIRHLVIIDDDRIELSNLNRQVLYSVEDIGQYKVDVCRRELMKQVPHALDIVVQRKRISRAEDLLPHLDGVDLVINSFGYPPFHMGHQNNFSVICRAAAVSHVPFMTSGGSWIGPLTIPGESGCYWCLENDPNYSDQINKVTQYIQPRVFQRYMPAFAPRIAMSSSLVVWEASRFLSGAEKAPSINNIIMLDLLNYQNHNLVPVVHSKQCAICNPEIKS